VRAMRDAATASSAVRFEGVSRVFGETRAVDGISFAVGQGELVTLLGPSGCGKTTTLRLIAGLELPSAGRITIAGQDVTALSASQRDVAMVFQSYALFPHMSVYENVSYGLRMSGVAKAERRARTEATLESVGLKGLGERAPSELSGGQQQRVAVARAVVLEPDVLLFDEPLSNLDAKLRRRVREDIRELQQRLGITAVYVTHDQEEALAISDRIIVMRDGRIAQEGTPRDLYERPADRFIADFIGDANVLEARIERVEGGIAAVSVAGAALSLPARGLGPGRALVAVRPHAVRLVARGEPGAIAARVRRATYLGSHVEYDLETAGGPVLAQAAEVEDLHRPGAEIGLVLAQNGVVLIRG
jgi:iron(III) transport system ATP-binding protein